MGWSLTSQASGPVAWDVLRTARDHGKKRVLALREWEVASKFPVKMDGRCHRSQTGFRICLITRFPKDQSLPALCAGPR